MSHFPDRLLKIARGCGLLVLGSLMAVFSQDLGHAATLAAETTIDLRRTDTNEVIALDSLEDALAETGVLANLPAGKSLSFFGTSVAGDQDSTLFIGASTDLLFVACLTGRIVSKEATANPGQGFSWTPSATEAETFDFDVARFLASTTVRLGPELQASLDALVKQQKNLIFWGALQRLNFNAQATSLPPVESVRRKYLLNPVTIRIRRGHTDVKSLARGVVKNFVKGLSEADEKTVEALLSPPMFVPKGGGLASGDWQGFRREFVRRLTKDPWRDPLSSSEIQPTDDDGKWLVVTKDRIM